MSTAYPSTPLHSQVTPKSILTEANRLVVHSGIPTRSTASTMPRHDYSYGHSNPALRPVVTDSPTHRTGMAS